jgi:hypothetical protein
VHAAGRLRRLGAEITGAFTSPVSPSIRAWLRTDRAT